MLGGIVFVLIVWFLPIFIWYFVQGKKEFSLKPNCESESKQQKMSKYMFYGALGFGFLILLLIILLGS